MSLRQHAEDYLALRRALGRKMAADGRMLLDFASRLDDTGQPAVTVAAALEWATESGDASPGHWRRRLGIIRGFARHMRTMDPATEVPPADLIIAPQHRKPPYIYSPEEISALVHAAGTITTPLAAAGMQALVSLIAATGLRLGEALGLDRDDVSIADAMLTVNGKNDSQRLVPLHPTTAAMLAAYAARRDRLCPAPSSPAFFLTRTGRRPVQGWAQNTFARLLIQAGIGQPPGRRRPRIHDLRHTFAVTTLTGWYQDGTDVQAQMPVLSTYLGHSNAESTYWYLEAAPGLLALAAARLEASAQKGTTR
ncbi:MAG TPA: tyrosine-type recombinase/integrase [Streptosporangiaceae bacterium]